MKILLAQVSFLYSWSAISEGEGQGKRGGKYRLQLLGRVSWHAFGLTRSVGRGSSAVDPGGWKNAGRALLLLTRGETAIGSFVGDLKQDHYCIASSATTLVPDFDTINTIT